jgi:hypothetical protein
LGLCGTTSQLKSLGGIFRGPDGLFHTLNHPLYHPPNAPNPNAKKKSKTKALFVRSEVLAVAF